MESTTIHYDEEGEPTHIVRRIWPSIWQWMILFVSGIFVVVIVDFTPWGNVFSVVVGFLFIGLTAHLTYHRDISTANILSFILGVVLISIGSGIDWENNELLTTVVGIAVIAVVFGLERIQKNQ